MATAELLRRLVLLSLATVTWCQKTCVVPSANGTSSDSPAIAKAFSDCASNATIVFEHGVEYNVFEPLNATQLSGVTISLQGNLNLPQNITYIQNLVKASGGSLTWFRIGGTDVQFLGSADVG